MALVTIKSKLSAEHKVDLSGIERVMHKMVGMERGLTLQGLSIEKGP